MEASAQQHVFVFVELASRRYGIPAERVQEVFPLLEPTPVPSWPPEVLGIMDIRGELIPLVDVAPLLGRPMGPLSKDQFIIRIIAKDANWGVLVDRIEGVRSSSVRTRADLTGAELLHLPKVCHGVTRDERDTILLLDPDELFADLYVQCRTLPILAIREEKKR